VSTRHSKTARASLRAGSAGGAGAVTVLGEYKYLIPLNGGRNAYVRNLVTGRSPNLRTDSEAFLAEIRQLAENGHGAKVRSELEQLHQAHPGDGWDVTAKRLVDAGVFPTAP
jgi:hypothetical protein